MSGPNSEELAWIQKRDLHELLTEAARRPNGQALLLAAILYRLDELSDKVRALRIPQSGEYAVRGSATEAWIRRNRENWRTETDLTDGYHALNNLLDDYRLRADTGVSLRGDSPSLLE